MYVWKLVLDIFDGRARSNYTKKKYERTQKVSCTYTEVYKTIVQL